MARKSKTQGFPKSVPVPVQQQGSDPENKQDDMKDLGIDPAKVVTLLDRWASEATTHWNDKTDYNLDKDVEESTRFYLGRQVDDQDPDASLDNRIFSSIQTIMPYALARITEPECYPSSNAVEARKFAEDFEKALHIKAQLENVKTKAEFATEDAIIKRRGYLKLRYDPLTENFCYIEYVPAESIIISHKAKAYEEPPFMRHELDTSVEKLISMFPDKEAKILELYGVVDQNDEKYYDDQVCHEDWVFRATDDGLGLFVIWSWKGEVLHAIKDPNWRYDQTNYLPHHMLPIVPFNVLNDGRGWIDRTSFISQAKYSQQNVDKRSRQINKAAGLGTVGMPVVDSEVLDQDKAQSFVYEEDVVMLLDVPDGKTLNDVFTKWQAGTLPSFVFDDKVDSRQSVDNAFGTNSLMRGESSSSDTLGQDILVRDQGQGRQQRIVNAVDQAMDRLYKLMAQFMLVYGSEAEMFKFVGEDGTFDYIIMNSDDLDTSAEIRVKSGTSMPIDKAQRRATADKAAQINMIDPLTYWEIMDEPNAQKIAKRVAEWTADPTGFMKETEDEKFDRDAYVDLQLILKNQQPPYRKELKPEYIAYLNQYVLQGNLLPENPTLDEETKQNVQTFIDTQVNRGQQILSMQETQLPTGQDIGSYNQQVDQSNAAAADAQKAAPPVPATPGQGPNAGDDPNNPNTAPGKSPVGQSAITK